MLFIEALLRNLYLLHTFGFSKLSDLFSPFMVGARLTVISSAMKIGKFSCLHMTLPPKISKFEYCSKAKRGDSTLPLVDRRPRKMCLIV